jgi:hypothetical protein
MDRYLDRWFAQFLEYLVNVEHDEWPKYHSMLVRAYVHRLLPMLTEYRKSLEGA